MLFALWSGWGLAMVVWTGLTAGIGPSRLSLSLGGGLVVTAAAGLLASGFLLGHARRRALAVPLIGYVAAWLMLAYAVGMFVSPANPPATRDIAAAVGLLYLAIPTLVAVGVATGVGVLVEFLLHRLIRRTALP